MRNRIASECLAGMMLVGASVASQGVAAAEPTIAGSSTMTKSEKWHGPFSSRASCIANTVGGFHALNVKKSCEKHTTDNKWWYATWL